MYTVKQTLIIFELLITKEKNILTHYNNKNNNKRKNRNTKKIKSNIIYFLS